MINKFASIKLCLHVSLMNMIRAYVRQCYIGWHLLWCCLYLQVCFSLFLQSWHAMVIPILFILNFHKSKDIFYTETSNLAKKEQPKCQKLSCYISLKQVSSSIPSILQLYKTVVLFFLLEIRQKSIKLPICLLFDLDGTFWKHRTRFSSLYEEAPKVVLDERRDQETTKVSQGAPILPSFLGWFSTTLGSVQ